jgi:hypothetical protein
MAFMTAPSAAGGGDRLPILKFDARAGRLFTIDRSQAADGLWQSQQTDITMTQPPFCVDFGSLEVGWAYFSAGGPPLWAVNWYGQPQPARPASPGTDDQNRPLQFKAAFRVKVAGQGIGGVREFGGNSAALIGGMNELHTRFEAAPEAATGKIPVVKMTNTQAIKSGQSTNYMPVFEIVAWVDRPKPLGERMVAPPGRTAVAAAAPPTSVPVPPPAPKPAPAPVQREPALVDDEMPF